MHYDSVRISSNDPRDLISDGNRHVPPPFSPRAHAARRPHVSILMQSVVRGLRHRSEAVGNQIDSFVQDRKFRTQFEQIVGQDLNLSRRRLIYHASIQNRER